MALANQPFAEMGAEKPSAARNENAFESRHERERFRGARDRIRRETAAFGATGCAPVSPFHDRPPP